jgi:hypothetical protein
MKNMNNLGKKNAEKIILKIWVQNIHSSIKVGSFCSVIQGIMPILIQKSKYKVYLLP